MRRLLLQDVTVWQIWCPQQHVRLWPVWCSYEWWWWQRFSQYWHHAPSSLSDLAKMDRDLKQAAMDIPAPETPAKPEPTSPTKKRFRTATDDDIKHFYDANQSANTKRVTAWGILHTTNIEWIHSKYYWYWIHIINMFVKHYAPGLVIKSKVSSFHPLSCWLKWQDFA